MSLEVVDSAHDADEVRLDLDADQQALLAATEALRTPKPYSGMTVMLTLGRSQVNAMTYRSYVDPQEARPDASYYRGDSEKGGKQRPTAKQMEDPNFRLHSSDKAISGINFEKPDLLASTRESKSEIDEEAKKEHKKFGTWDGVFVSCILNIFGVIMFLRIGWVVGQAGIPLALVIIGTASAVTTLTSLSMSAICTNGEVKAGGAYFLISRALGPKIGGAVGFMFSIGLTVAIAMYIIGFCETLVEELDGIFTFTGSFINDVRIWGLIVLLIVFLMAYIGTAWVIKLQLGLLAVLMGAIISFMIGTFTMTPNPAEGLLGYSSGIIKENAKSLFLEQEGKQYGFFEVFGVYFPAATGILAGANISGDLANPAENIPKGTLCAIGFTTIIYATMAVVCGAVVDRNFTNAAGENFGLLWDSLIMVKIAVWGPLVSIGIYIATFSSALASIVGGPRVLQMLASDGIIPFLDYFKVVRERDGAPVRGYVAALVLGAGCVLIGELNAIAPLITMFFMLTYGLINLSCMALSLSKSPGWRPEFRFYTWWGACLGGIMCIVIMFLTSWIYTIVSLFIAAGIYLYIEKKAVLVNWGTANEGQKDVAALRAIMSLKTSQDHIKTFRPHYLVMAGDVVNERLWLMEFMDTLKNGFGAVIYGRVVIGEFAEYTAGTGDTGPAIESRVEVVDADRPANDRQGYVIDQTSGICGLVDTMISPDYRAGAQALMQVGGMGRLRPNTVVMGFKESWFNFESSDVEKYVGTIRDAMALNLGVMILRGMKRMDFKAKFNGTKGIFDVYWLADDGGLTVLVMHIMCMHPFWKSRLQKVRLNLVVENDSQITDLYKLVHEMMHGFRIKWDVNVIPAGKIPPTQSTLDMYDDNAETPVEEQTRTVVTKRWLRTVDLMRENSKDSALILSLMPKPRSYDKSSDYMALLECVSSIGPPVVMMRGNGQNCLTFGME